MQDCRSPPRYHPLTGTGCPPPIESSVCLCSLQWDVRSEMHITDWFCGFVDRLQSLLMTPKPRFTPLQPPTHLSTSMYFSMLWRVTLACYQHPVLLLHPTNHLRVKHTSKHMHHHRGVARWSSRVKNRNNQSTGFVGQKENVSVPL